jgi:peptide/nickel transport system ATP-binding protein
MGLTMLFITHDLRVAAQISDRIAVMKNGEIVEMGTARAVFEHSTNDYTKSLLASMPGMKWDVPQIESASA